MVGVFVAFIRVVYGRMIYMSLPEYIKYDIEEYYCLTSSSSRRKVHMILIENCYSMSLSQLRVPLLLKEYQYNSSTS